MYMNIVLLYICTSLTKCCSNMNAYLILVFLQPFIICDIALLVYFMCMCLREMIFLEDFHVCAVLCYFCCVSTTYILIQFCLNCTQKPYQLMLNRTIDQLTKNILPFSFDIHINCPLTTIIIICMCGWYHHYTYRTTICCPRLHTFIYVHIHAYRHYLNVIIVLIWLRSLPLIRIVGNQVAPHLCNTYTNSY